MKGMRRDQDQDQLSIHPFFPYEVGRRLPLFGSISDLEITNIATVNNVWIISGYIITKIAFTLIV